MNVLRFILLPTMFLWFHCSTVAGSALEKNGSPPSPGDMDHPYKQQNIETSRLLSDLSEEEREWYRKFQEGLMFFSGWKEISADILQALPADERPLTERLLEDMGVRIGTEWSKDNDIRKIDTDQLRSWGDRLRKASKKGDTHLSQTVKAISAEVDELLNLPRRDDDINNS